MPTSWPAVGAAAVAAAPAPQPRLAHACLHCLPSAGNVFDSAHALRLHLRHVHGIDGGVTGPSAIEVPNPSFLGPPAPEGCAIFELNAIEIGSVPLAAVDSEWEEFPEVTVDSGAGDSVANPSIMPDIPLLPSPGSARGQN